MPCSAHGDAVDEIGGQLVTEVARDVEGTRCWVRISRWCSTSDDDTERAISDDDDGAMVCTRNLFAERRLSACAQA